MKKSATSLESLSFSHPLNTALFIDVHCILEALTPYGGSGGSVDDHLYNF